MMKSKSARYSISSWPPLLAPFSKSHLPHT